MATRRENRWYGWTASTSRWSNCSMPSSWKRTIARPTPRYMQSSKAKAAAASEARRWSLDPEMYSSARRGCHTVSKPTNRRCCSVFRIARCNRHSIFGAKRSNPLDVARSTLFPIPWGGGVFARPNRGETLFPEQYDERGQNKLRPSLQSAARSQGLSGNLRPLGKTLGAGPRRPRLLFGRALRPRRTGKNGHLSRARKKPRAFNVHPRRILAFARQETFLVCRAAARQGRIHGRGTRLRSLPRGASRRHRDADGSGLRVAVP